MQRNLTIFTLLLPVLLSAQATFSTMGVPYTQNFNSLPNTVDGAAPTGGWTDNTTLVGWYSSSTPIVEASTASMNNTGANYIIASGADRSFGSRASGGTGTCYYGVRLVNSTGATITSVYVQYYGEQWSIAENQTNVNTIGVDYKTGTGLTSLTTGVWTNVPSLGFTQLYTSAQSAGMGGTACAGSSAQCLALNGNSTANRTLIAACVSVTLNPGDEILFRWVDVNDAANDHHMQIDDVSIYPFDVSCAIVLPIELLSFTAEAEGFTSVLQWETGSEDNNDYFVVERLNEMNAFDSIGIVDGNGTTSQANSYHFIDADPHEGINYYRLKQVDFNGQHTYSEIRTTMFQGSTDFTAFVYYDGSLQFHQSGNAGETYITMYSQQGELVYEAKTEATNGVINTPLSAGIYLVIFENDGAVVVAKTVILPGW